MQYKIYFIILILNLGFLLSIDSYPQLTSHDKNLKTELRLCRNEIYAIYGRKFKSKDLNRYFNSQEWYQSIENFHDSLLSDRESLAAKTLLTLEKNFDNFTNKEKLHTKGVLKTIRKYYNRQIDTSFLTLGNFDGVQPTDTIISHITDNNKIIIIEYSYLRNGEVIWSHTHKDPFLEIINSKTYEELSKNLFVSGYLAIKRCPAKVYKSENLESIIKKHAFEFGFAKLKKKGIKVSESDYRRFIDTFDNDVLSHSYNEWGSKVQIWYEPAKEFVTIYHP